MTSERRKCLVVGAGGQSRAVLSILQEPANRDKFEVIGILDLAYQGVPEEVLGLAVIGSLEDLAEFRGKACSLFLAIGDNLKRSEVFLGAEAHGFHFPNLISQHALISASATLQPGNIVCPNAYIGPYVKLGSNNLLNTKSIVEHEAVVGSHCHVAPAAIICGRVTIGNFTMVGAGAIITDNKKIASKTIIGAGSVVGKDIDVEGGTYVGLPARHIKR